MLAVAEAPITAAPRFHSATEALRWAYRQRRGDTRIADVFLIGSPPFDVDAANMIAAVDALPDHRTREYLRARFDGAEDYEHLRMWVIAGLPSGLHKGRALQRMIGAHFGHEAGLKSLQRDLRCTAAKPIMLTDVIEYRRIVRERLIAIRDIALPALKKLFRERGWVL